MAIGINRANVEGAIYTAVGWFKVARIRLENGNLHGSVEAAEAGNAILSSYGLNYLTGFHPSDRISFLAGILGLAGNRHQACVELESGLELVCKARDPKGERALLVQLALIKVKAGKPTEAMKLLIRARQCTGPDLPNTNGDIGIFDLVNEFRDTIFYMPERPYFEDWSNEQINAFIAICSLSEAPERENVLAQLRLACLQQPVERGSFHWLCAEAACALSEYDLAIQFGTKAAEATMDALASLQRRARIAYYQLAAGRTNEASETLLEVLGKYEDYYSLLPTLETRRDWLRKYVVIAVECVSLLLKAGRVDEAWEVLQRYKGERAP